MSRRLKRASAALVVVFAAAQFVRPGRANPATVASRTIESQQGTTTALAAVLERGCRDCHSNETEWRWYTQIAPVSWLMAYGVAEGRKAVNFSEWAAYPPALRRTLLLQSCEDATSGKMPGVYARLRPDTRLSAQDVQTICAATRETDAHAADRP